MSTAGASDQPSAASAAASQPLLASDLVVETNGNQRARPTAEVLRNQPLLERAVTLQVNQINACISTLEAMRVNLNRMETALVLLETGVVEQSNRKTVVEAFEAPAKVAAGPVEQPLINQGAEQDNQVLEKPGAEVINQLPSHASVS